MTPAAPLISVVVPCFNEEQVLPQTHARLSEALGKLGTDYEIVYVNDGSRDGTEALLRQIQAADARVRVVMFARNFGHQTAVTAGVDVAAGNAVAVIDADLQDPPEVIAEMVAKWREGYDVVYGVRADREGETPFKLWTAHAFYRFINYLSEVAIPLDTGDFRLMDRKVVEALKRMPEHDRFLRGMVAWLGFRQFALPYRRAARAAGVTKYPLKKMLRLAMDGILSFSLKPLRLASVIGLLALFITVIGLFITSLGVLFGKAYVMSAVIWLIAMLASIQLIAIGIIGEYIGRTYVEVKQRPLYVVHETLGFVEK